MENLPNSAQRGLRERYYIFPVGLSVNDAAAMSAHSSTSLKKKKKEPEDKLVRLYTITNRPGSNLETLGFTDLFPSAIAGLSDGGQGGSWRPAAGALSRAAVT